MKRRIEKEAARRTRTLLHQLNLEGRGLEIGPSFNPVAPKRLGYRVDVLDCMSRDQLVSKYSAHGINTSLVEEVDYVWKGESFAALLGGRNKYDWIVASHVIEHTTDLIGFLNNCADVLKPDGVLSLAIPDKRYCFDRFRPISGLGQAIDRHLDSRPRHSAGVVAEARLYEVSRGSRISWSRHFTGAYKFRTNYGMVKDELERVRAGAVDPDVHAWCFVPSSFRLMMHDLYDLGFLALKEVEFVPARGCEFFMKLGPSGKGLAVDRLQLLEQIDDEQRQTGLTLRAMVGCVLRAMQGKSHSRTGP